MAPTNILIYLLRHDLRVSDNPILHHLATAKDHGFTHLLPVYVFPAHQVEISGFIRDGSKSPYGEARSQVGGFWRCGPHRVRFLADAVWDVKNSFKSFGSDLCLRAGKFDDVLQGLIQGLSENQHKVGAVWMTGEESVEEKRDERAVSAVCEEHNVEFKKWQDEKYFVDDRDTGLDSASELPDVFTSYRKTQEPLRERPRSPLPKPEGTSLPPYPDASSVPEHPKPFEMPTTHDDLKQCLLKPIENLLLNPPQYPENAESVHPFDGGEQVALSRLQHLIKSGSMATYKDTRNGLLGVDFSTKLSAFLAFGCLTARQVHDSLVQYEDGTNDEYKGSQGYGKGENDGTRGVRFELLWRDYMRLCTKKFGPRLFRVSGFREYEGGKWKTADRNGDGNAEEISNIIQRFIEGTTGMGLIDASQRELYHTGYTSNRARQNVASFLTKHLGIDWRYGAEWYECMLVDYDVSSNWSNWQYVAGVGNDPRGEARIFNPVKQAFDYDKDGSYVKTWVPEVKNLDKLENVFQAWTASREQHERENLVDHIMVTHPVKKIDFSVEGKPKGSRRPYNRRRGRGGGQQGGGQGGGHGGGHHGGGSGGGSNGSAAGHYNSHGNGQDSNNNSSKYNGGAPNGGYGQMYQGYNNGGRGQGGYRGSFRGHRGRGGNGYGGYRGGRGDGYPGYNNGRGGYAAYQQNGYPNGYMQTGRPQWTTANPGMYM